MVVTGFGDKQDSTCSAHWRTSRGQTFFFRGALERTHEGDFLSGWKSRTHGKNESMRYGV